MSAPTMILYNSGSETGGHDPPGGHGAIAREPWAHIEKIYFSRIDTEIWTFGIFGNFYPKKCNILQY